MSVDGGLPMRVGIGYDSHRFAEGHGVLLGGVLIPANVRCKGHSDADAVCHALTDAILGGAGVGDIGRHHAFDGGGGADRHEDRRIDDAVREGQLAAPCGAIGLADGELNAQAIKLSAVG